MLNNKASFGQRLIAEIFDYLIGWTIFGFFVVQASSQSSLGGILSVIFSLIITYIWYWIALSIVQALLIAKFGASFGKLLTGLKIVKENGANLNFKEAFFRELILKRVSQFIFWLGYFWMLKDQDKQTWHDMLLNTYVVRTSSSGLVIGLAVVLALIAFNGLQVSRSLNNFKSNSAFYEQLVNEVKSSINQVSETQNSLKELNELQKEVDDLEKTQGSQNTIKYQYNYQTN